MNVAASLSASVRAFERTAMLGWSIGIDRTLVEACVAIEMLRLRLSSMLALERVAADFGACGDKDDMLDVGEIKSSSAAGAIEAIALLHKFSLLRLGASAAITEYIADAGGAFEPQCSVGRWTVIVAW